MELSKKKAKFFKVYRVQANARANIGRLDIYGEISEVSHFKEDFTPFILKSELNKLGRIDQLDVHISSPGGDVEAGLAIYSILKQRSEIVNVYIEGTVASIATVIACAGDNVYIDKTARMMVHNPWAELKNVDMNADDAREFARYLDKSREPMLKAYSHKTGKEAKEIIRVLKGEKGKGTWFTAEQAIEFGLADDYIKSPKKSLEYIAKSEMPVVASWRGYALEQPTDKKIKNTGGNKIMARRKAKVKRRPRAEVILIDTTCPYCEAVNLLNPETAEVVLGSTGTPPQASNRRKPRAEAQIFIIACLDCNEEYEWDTTTHEDGDYGEPVTDTVPMGGGHDEYDDEPVYARRKNKPTRNRQIKATRFKKPRAEVLETICPECSYPVPYDTDHAIEIAEDGISEGYFLQCMECGNEFIEPIYYNEEIHIPEDLPVAVAYTRGISSERRRVSAFFDMLDGTPEQTEFIQNAIRNGSTFETLAKEHFKAQKTPKNQYLNGIQRDRQRSGVNSMKMPIGGPNRKNYVHDRSLEIINERRNKGGTK